MLNKPEPKALDDEEKGKRIREIQTTLPKESASGCSQVGRTAVAGQVAAGGKRQCRSLCGNAKALYGTKESFIMRGSVYVLRVGRKVM